MIFEGKITKIVTVPGDTSRVSYNYNKITFEILKTYKGEQLKSVTIISPATSCGLVSNNKENIGLVCILYAEKNDTAYTFEGCQRVVFKGTNKRIIARYNAMGIDMGKEYKQEVDTLTAYIKDLNKK